MMKRTVYCLLLLLYVNCICAQSDITKIRAIYNSDYLKYEEDDSLSRDISLLDIGTYASRFCSLVGEWYNLNPVGRAPYPGTTIKDDDVYKNIPYKGKMLSVHFPGRIVTQDAINNLFDWQLLEGDSTVCGYPCHKAQTTFRGRTWTAWYTLDLPYSDGPWKLCGLPGLILHACDSEGKFVFNCIGIENGDGHPFTYKIGNHDNIVSAERAEELLILEAADRDGYYKLIMPGLTRFWVTDKNGRIIKQMPKTAVPYEVFPQNHKKKPAKKKPATKKRRRR